MINRRWPGIVLLTIALVQAQGKLADPELEYPAYTPNATDLVLSRSKYIDQLHTAMSKTSQNDAINCYLGKINGNEIILAVMNFGFIGGSMGSVVGELVSRSVEMAREKKIAFVLVCS